MNWIIASQSFALSPCGNGVCRNGRGVMGDADKGRAAVCLGIIDSVGDGDPGGVGAKVVIVDRKRGPVPLGDGILEVTEQFSFS